MGRSFSHRLRGTAGGRTGARKKMTSPGGAALQVPLEREHFGRKPGKWFGAGVWRECG